MSGAAEVLVIVLAVVLAIFLILAIVLAAILIKVTKQIKDVTGTAQRTAANLEHAASNVSKFSSPVMIGRMVGRQFAKYKNRRG